MNLTRCYKTEGFLHLYLQLIYHILCDLYQWYLFKKQQIYFHTKLRWHISIHGWDNTTSGFGKQTAAILELCFLFRLWRM